MTTLIHTIADANKKVADVSLDAVSYTSNQAEKLVNAVLDKAPFVKEDQQDKVKEALRSYQKT